MKLGILSDTHGYFHPSLETYLRDVDLILHAGDVGTTDVLDRLEAIAPVQAVWGNVDGHDIRHRSTEVLRTDVDGLRVMMTHIGGTPGKWNRSIGAVLRSDPPDIFICGHSHILRVERVRDLANMLYINPGAAGRQGFHQVKTCIRLDVFDGSARQAEVVHLDD